jgi:hypothetical protein
VRPPAGPAAIGAPESPSRELICPPPVPIAELRAVAATGAVHAVTAEDFAVQYDTNQSPAAGIVTVGVVADVVVACATPPATAATGDDVLVPEYAASWTLPLTEAGNVTLTVDPGSEAVATRLQIAVVMTVFGSVATRVHPAGALGADVATPVATSNIVSPAATEAGTVTLSLAAFLVTPVAATKPIAGGGLCVTPTLWVSTAVSPSPFVTVSVTGYVPGDPYV